MSSRAAPSRWSGAISIVPLPEAERERWRTVLQPVTDGWVEQVNAMGHDGEAMLADATTPGRRVRR